jgi:peptidyl-tRNA hydrolase
MKQVLVVNQSLRLPSGKLAAQVAHAAVGAYLRAAPAAQKLWVQQGMAKIVVVAADADALMELERAALAAGLPACLVRDAGRTVVAAGTVTCLGLGPADDALLNTLTGALRLL